MPAVIAALMALGFLPFPLAADEKADLFHGTAARTYRLTLPVAS